MVLKPCKLWDKAPINWCRISANFRHQQYYSDNRLILLFWICKVNKQQVAVHDLGFRNAPFLDRQISRVSLKLASDYVTELFTSNRHPLRLPSKERSMFLQVQNNLFFSRWSWQRVLDSDQERFMRLKKANKEIWTIAHWWWRWKSTSQLILGGESSILQSKMSMSVKIQCCHYLCIHYW